MLLIEGSFLVSDQWRWYDAWSSVLYYCRPVHCETGYHSSLKWAIAALTFTRFKEAKHLASHRSHGRLPLHHHICSQLSHWFSFFFGQNNGILFYRFRVKACKHSTCRNHAGLCWALNRKMRAASPAILDCLQAQLWNIWVMYPSKTHVTPQTLLRFLPLQSYMMKLLPLI